MKIKNKLTGTSGGVGEIVGKGEHVQRTRRQGQWEGDCL